MPVKTISVVELLAGQKGKIVELDTADREILGKLMSLGIVPGAQLGMIRRKPAVLLQVGHTKVALDRRLAAHIRVERRD
jgi:ferrous iron transport protein A